ncbi:MAG: AlpA family phage regulatory protein [Sulfuricella denitrificans]|nr:AlpA family phage regulatory protein [Sulfuricella denitrificans]
MQLREQYQPKPRYGRAADLATILACHPSAVWRKAAADPSFPQPLNLSRRHTVFDLNQLDAWLEQQASKTKEGV